MGRRGDDGNDRASSIIVRLDDEVEEMWTALTEWAEGSPPPPGWRPDIGLMANETVRRVAWLVERNQEAAACWEVFAQHVIARDQPEPATPE